MKVTKADYCDNITELIYINEESTRLSISNIAQGEGLHPLLSVWQARNLHLSDDVPIKSQHYNTDNFTISSPQIVMILFRAEHGDGLNPW